MVTTYGALFLPEVHSNKSIVNDSTLAALF